MGNLNGRLERLERATGVEGCEGCGFRARSPVRFVVNEHESGAGPQWCPTCGRQLRIVLTWGDSGDDE